MAEEPELSESTVALNQTGHQQPHRRRVLTSAVVVLTMGVGIWWTVWRPRPTTSASQAPAAPLKTVLPLESFTVNLADQEEGRFLRTTLALGVGGELPKPSRAESKTPESGTVSIATIRDSIISVLSQCKSEDLLTPIGKSKLKADIIESLNHDVPALQAREVYFTEFLVQR